MDSNYLKWASELKEEFPEATKCFNVEQVARIWRNHSHDLCAGWLTSTGNQPEGMLRIFDQYHIQDGKILKTTEVL